MRSETMTHAYNESYLHNAKDLLAGFFDYAVNDCGLTANWVASLFVVTGYAALAERGNPAILAGMSGAELAQAVIRKAYTNKELPAPTFRAERTPEYWAGWALAEYQWSTAHRFRDIFERIPLADILNMYSVYHEMDITAFIDGMNQRYESTAYAARLKTFRENRGLSQKELAALSGVKLRSIQMYEQKVNDIDKAQVRTLFKLSRVLGCDIEDLLENPLQQESQKC